MTAAIRSTSRSGTRGTARTGLRTGSVSRTPRPHGLFEAPRPAWWQLTTRPPRGCSSSQLPVEAGVSIFVRAGRTIGGQ